MFVDAPAPLSVDTGLRTWAAACELPPPTRARPSERDARIHALLHIDAIGVLRDPVWMPAQRDAFILHACSLAVRIGPWGWEHLREVLTRTPLPLHPLDPDAGAWSELSEWLLRAIADDHRGYVEGLAAGSSGLVSEEESLLYAVRHQEAVERALRPIRPLAVAIALGRWHANYSAPDAARFADVPAAKWRSWEEDRARPSSANLRSVARALGWPLENLVAAADGAWGHSTPVPSEFCQCGSTTFTRTQVPLGEGCGDDDEWIAVLACTRCGQLWVDDGARMLWTSNVSWCDDEEVPARRQAVIDHVGASDVDSWCVASVGAAVDTLRH